MTVRLPFGRRRSRWQRLRTTMSGRGDLRSRLPEPERLREALPDPTALRRRVQPLVERAAAARPELTMPEPPAFLHGGLDRLTHLGRRQASPTERILNAQAPLWVLLTAAAGAFVLGYLLGQAAARRASIAPEELEAAADKIKDTWPAVHDDDIREARGNLKRLSSVIGERTGEDARSVRERLTAITGRRPSSNGGRASE